jgi:hypothetical protein
MITSEERMQVLKMVERGRLSAAEAVELLSLLGSAVPAPSGPEGPPEPSTPSRMRVRVSDLATGEPKVDITLPWGLASTGVDMGARFTPRDVDIDLADIRRAAETGAGGKVLEMVDEVEAERVEIFVD